MPARLRPRAKQDLADTAVCYAEQGGSALGSRFLEAATTALKPLRRMPGLGSPRAQACGIPGLRVWGVSGWPVAWLYVERDAFLDVLRLLGERQDMAAILHDDNR